VNATTKRTKNLYNRMELFLFKRLISVKSFFTGCRCINEFKEMFHISHIPDEEEGQFNTL